MVADQTSRERPLVVVRGLVPDEHGRFLFIHEAGPGLWVPPGGRLEHGEEMVDAVAREVYEETGYKTTVDRFAFTYDQYLKSIGWHVVQFYFLMEPVQSADLQQNWKDIDQEYDYGTRQFKFMDVEAIHQEDWVEPQFITDYMTGTMTQPYVPYMKQALKHEETKLRKKA